MTSKAQAAASGFTEYGVHFRPLNLGDYADLDVWMQDTYRRGAIKSAMSEGLRGAELDSYFRTMHEHSSELTTTTEYGKRMVATIAGGLRILALASDGACTLDHLLKEAGPKALEAVGELGYRIRMLDLEPDDLAEKPKGDGAASPFPAQP